MGTSLGLALVPVVGTSTRMRGFDVDLWVTSALDVAMSGGEVRRWLRS